MCHSYFSLPEGIPWCWNMNPKICPNRISQFCRQIYHTRMFMTCYGFWASRMINDKGLKQILCSIRGLQMLKLLLLSSTIPDQSIPIPGDIYIYTHIVYTHIYNLSITSGLVLRNDKHCFDGRNPPKLVVLATELISMEPKL